MRTIVVGASTGLGRCIGIGLAQRGADVALLARREDLLADAAKEAGPGTLAIRCDVTDEASCRQAMEEAARGLGGIDAVVYATGISVLRKIEDLTPADWQHTFATNVIGASQVTAAALPHLVVSKGVAAYLSSVSASLTAPWPGLASYTVTKAALEKLVEAWRSEHPDIGFTRIVVGECTGGEGHGMTQFTAQWDMELAAEMFPIWTARGVLTDKLMDVEHLVGAVDAVLRFGATAGIPSIAVTPRRPI
jgi:NAD(P)-dependent dehydrogenase (short-subunit alcohol dehydrogenase family)